MLLPLHLINDSDRQRKDYGDLESLKESLTQHGQLQGLLVSVEVTISLHEDTGLHEYPHYTLVAGGRRLRAMRELGWAECEVTVREDVSPEDLLEMEIVENVVRKSMTWQEEARGVARIYRARQKKAALDSAPPFTLALAGALFGCSHANVGYILKVVDSLDDPEVSGQSSMFDAYKLLVQRATRAAEAELHRQTQERLATMTLFDPLIPSAKAACSDEGECNPEDWDAIAADAKYGDGTYQAEYLAASLHPLTLSMLQCRDSIKWMFESCAPGVIDHIVTDIPYGIDMDNLNVDEVVERQHDVDANLALFDYFLKGAWRVLRDGGYCVFFFDIEHYRRLRDNAEHYGFKVQRWPNYWVKTTQCSNGAAHVNFTKTVEVAMVLRKGNAVFNSDKQGPLGHFIGGLTSAERAQFQHPFTKPQAVWKWLMEPIAFRGQTILDPFCGEGSGVLAAQSLGLLPLGMDIEQVHIDRARVHLDKQLRGPTTPSLIDTL